VKRIAAAAVVLVLVVVAALLTAPEPAPEPLAGLIIDRPGIESPVDAAIWYCPWAQSDAERDSFLGVASIAPATEAFTFPVAIPGEPADTADTSTPGPGASGVLLSDVAVRGDSPGFIEFVGGPSAATVTVSGSVLTADDCVATGPTEWYFAGGSTMTGEHLVLRLFNPFPEVAKVTVSGFSEIGVEALGDLRSVSVNPRSWRDIEFAEMLRQRQTLIISVRAVEGLAVPAMSWTSGPEEAWWAGTDLSTTWEFPILRQKGLDGTTLVVANPQETDVDVTVDFYGVDGPVGERQSYTIPAQAPLRIALDGIEPTVVGAVVTATSPVAASVSAIGEAGTAVTAGSPDEAQGWLLPGLRSDKTATATLWLLNPGDDAVSVTLSALGSTSPVNSRVVLEPGTVTRIPIEATGAQGYLATSTDWFSAAWTLSGPSGTAYVAGIPLPGDPGTTGTENVGGDG
jgi:hypothetical protein